MGVVAPGNKQIGSFTFDLLQSSRSRISVNASIGTSLTQEQTTVLPVAPYRVQLGHYSLSLLTSSNTRLSIQSSLGVSLVKYNPPSTLYFHSALGLAAVKDMDTIAVLASPKNVAISSFTVIGLQSSKPSFSIRSVLGVALVQYFDQRKESIHHSINYGLVKTVKV